MRACSTARAAWGVDHTPIIPCQFLAQMGRRLGQQIPQFVIGTALDRELRPLHFKRRFQSRVAIDYRQHRSTEIAGCTVSAPPRAWPVRSRLRPAAG